jgi:hypothetical protein
MTVVFFIQVLYNGYMEHIFYFPACPHPVFGRLRPVACPRFSSPRSWGVGVGIGRLHPVSGCIPLRSWVEYCSNLITTSQSEPKMSTKINFVFFFVSLLNSSTGNAFKQKKIPKIRSFCTHLIDIFPIYQTFISDDSLVSGLRFSSPPWQGG